MAAPPPICARPGAVPPLLEAPRRLTAGRATTVLAGYLGAQVVVGVFAGIAGAALQIGRGHTPSGELPQEVMVPAMLLAVVVGAVAMLIMSLLLVRPHLRERSPAGAAWVVGSKKGLALGLILGIVVAVGSSLLAGLFGPGPDPTEMGPLATMATTPGFAQIAWLLIALVIAPPTEELLFRGVLYAGFFNSFGPARAAVFTTAIFVLFHITELVYFLPSALGVTALALTALWLRVRAAAVGPAITAHIGYNGVVAVVAVAFSSQ